MSESSATATAPATLPGYPDVPAGAILAGAARRYADRAAVHFGGRELSFTALHERACAFANALVEAGVRPGDVVAAHLPNCPQYPIAYYGILLAGATFSPTNPLLPPGDLAAQLADCGAVAAITWALDGTAPGPVQALMAVRDRTAVRLALVTDRAQALDPTHRVDAPAGTTDFEAFHAGAPTTTPDVAVDPGSLAHLAYTGGTTGRSKGVQLPHRNVVVNTLQFGAWSSGSVVGLDAQGGLVLDQVGTAEEYPQRLGTGVGVTVTPWFHAMGTIAGLNVQVLCGTTLVLHERFEPGAFLADVERFGATSIGGAPPLFAALVRHPDFATRDLSSVRSLGSGAAPLPVELIRALERRLGADVVITEGYGLTEVTCGATVNPAARSAVRKPGTVGLPLPGTEIRVVGEDGAPLPTGEAGEVCIRGPQVMTGYRARAAETAATLREGWLHTGDVGVLDDDGYLRIVDRLKDMLLYKGYNVYPREIEELLFAAGGVAGAAVVGRPDPVAGELPVAFVVAPGLTDAGAATLMAAVNEQLTPYKRLREIHLVDAIPVSAAGKVLKRELRERLAGEAQPNG
ncbi:MAG: class I adenylate-forming enzyme family protein [Pseudonocardia sp.]